MSRRTWKLSDFDKYLKPLHLGGKQHTLTVTHIGVEPVKSRKREWTIAGDAPDEQGDEFLMILHFREFPKPLRTNALSRDVLRKAVGDDLPRLIGAKVTLRVVTLKQFGGQECIEIVSCELAKGVPKPQPTPEPEPEESWEDTPADTEELPAEVIIADELAHAEPPAAPPPGYVPPAEKVRVPSHENAQPSAGNGNTTKPVRPYSLDLLRRAISTRAEKSYDKLTITPGHRGQINGALDALLGNIDKRHEFLFAVTGHKSSKDIADNYMESLWDWVNGDLATIKAEANNAIVESLKAQGQTELPRSE